MLELVLAMKRLAAILVLCTACVAALAQESRTIRPVPRPSPGGKFMLPQGAVPAVRQRPVEREDVEAAVRKVLQAWNERKLDVVLGPDFRDRQRLIDTMQSRVPRDARLRLIALQSWQVVGYFNRKGVDYAQVSVTVRTQVEYNDPTAGFQRREGTNDFLLSIGEQGR